MWISSHQCLPHPGGWRLPFGQLVHHPTLKKSRYLGAQSCWEGNQWGGLLIPGPTMGLCGWWHPADLGCKALCRAHGLAENCSSLAGMGQEDGAWWWEGPSTFWSPEHPRTGTAALTLRCLTSPSDPWGSAWLLANLLQAISLMWKSVFL